jgi:hypothetical protein
MLGPEASSVNYKRPGRRNLVDQAERGTMRPGPAARHCVGSDDWTGFPVEPPISAINHSISRSTAPTATAAVLGFADRY